MESSPYRSWRRALTHRRASLDQQVHELVYALSRLRRRDARSAHRRVSRQLQRVKDELSETDELLGGGEETPTPPVRWSSSGGLLAALLVLVLVVLSLGAARDTSPPDAQTFDPNAIDGADTRPRTELE